MGANNTEKRLGTTEDFLAERIEKLRTKEGWSFADLSQRMAEAGCPIERSSLQKIERGKPRRKITVNELVAFSRVFNVEAPDLMVSPMYNAEEMFLQDLENGPRLAAEAFKAQTRLLTLVNRVADACREPVDGPTREQRLRKAAAATAFDDDSNKRIFLESVLSIVDIYREDGDDEG